MHPRISSRVTYANVVSTLALALVLSGGAYAATTQLTKDSVRSKHIKNNAVKSKDIKDGALTAADLKAGVIDAEVAGTPMNGDLTGTFPNPTVDPGLFVDLVTQSQMEAYVDVATDDSLQKDEGEAFLPTGPNYVFVASLPDIVEVDARCTAAGPNRALEVRITNNQDFTWDFVVEQRSQTAPTSAILSSDVAGSGGTYSIVFAPDTGTQAARSFELTSVDAPGIRLKGVALTNTLSGDCRVNASVTYDDEGVV